MAFDPNGPAQPGDFQETSNELIRTQEFSTPEPVSLDISNILGPVTVRLTDTATTRIEVRHDPTSGGPDWRGGLSNLLSWVSEQFGESGLRAAWDNGRSTKAPISEAVRQTRVTMTGNRLVVRTPNMGPLRSIPLAIEVHAPENSEVGIHIGSGEATVTGTALRANIQSGSGTVSVERTAERATIRSGAGPIRLGTVTSGVHARSSSGDIEITNLTGPSTVVTGSGNVWLGSVDGNLLVRSGSGSLTVAEARSGQLELITGSGDVQITLQRDRTAEVDLTSATGTVASDLDVSDQAPEREPEMRIHARTGTGSALLTSAS